MKTLTTFTALIALLAVSTASLADPKWKDKRWQPEHRGAVYDYAKVVEVEPLTRIVHTTTPERECWQEPVSYPVEYRNPRDSARGTLVGGVIGAVIGHELGHHNRHDRHAATAVGTLIGASIGRDAASRAGRVVEQRVVYEDRCQVTERRSTEERIDGYLVTYRYKGEIFRTRLPYDPGKHIRVRIDVAPAERY